MRLSYQKQTDIREAILNDLYNPPRKKLDDKKSALVMRNHSELMASPQEFRIRP